jgi:hypothetical protein
METGIDSLGMVELRDQLHALTGVALSATIIFEQPTARAITNHLLEHTATTRADYQDSFFRVNVAMLPMSTPMLHNCACGSFHMLQTYKLEPDDDNDLIRLSLERLVAYHPMLRSVMTPPVFRIKQRVEFELDHGDLPRYDDSLCSGLLKCAIDLSRSVFRARIYNVDSQPAFLALSIHHVVLDGRSQQIVYATLSQILTDARLGLETEQPVYEAYSASKLAEDATESHLRVLEAGPQELQAQPLPLLLPSARASTECMLPEGVGIVGMRGAQRILSPSTVEMLTLTATSCGVTLNSILLGTLATYLRGCCSQNRFAIKQTYLGRRPDQLNAVGSYSQGVDMEFAFDDESSLLATCHHVFAETMKNMALMNKAEAATNLYTNVCYELNDMRPIPLSSSVPDMEVVLCDLFFVVDEYVDGCAAIVMYDVNKFEHADAELFLDGWLEGLKGAALESA